MGNVFGKDLNSEEEDVEEEDVMEEDVEEEDVEEEDVEEEDVMEEDVEEEDVEEEDVVEEAVKRKATEDDQNPQEKCRRLDSIHNEMPSTSKDLESRNEPVAVLTQRSPKRKADDEPGETMKRTLGPSAMFKAKYQQLEGLGEGGFGFVFAGYRKADYLDVVIKHIPKDQLILYHEDNTGKLIPMEVAVMLKLAAVSERHSAHVGLLDWYELEEEVILVLERPMPAVDLLQYILAKGGCLEEKEAKIIMRQLVDAAIDLQEKHIFHRHIKVENLLVETRKNRLKVRVIDFGLSCFTEEGEKYETFYGTHIPPEWYSRRHYMAGPTTAYQIGAVLVDMLQNTHLRSDIFFLRKEINWRFSESKGRKKILQKFHQGVFV
ncbi:serine/threonine-protein kinase pim-2-like isoform X2 [Clinocottus analis]|uniref:serine/threonine-protein kinase pim-2-like isoform X2 n=1 Tax=Clinocottus analis TaxID=304258 RepID=UPI0035C18C28